MRLLKALTSLVNTELAGGVPLERVEVVSSPEWLWIICDYGQPLHAGILRTLIQAYQPLQAGEFVAPGEGPEFALCREEYIIEERSEADLAALLSHAPHYVSVLQRASHRAILRIASSREPLDAVALKYELERSTWLHAGQPPNRLRGRGLELLIGAQRATLRPDIRDPIGVLSSGDDLYALFHREANTEPTYDVFAADGCMRSIPIPRQALMEAIEFPVGDAYGFVFAVPIHAEAFVRQNEGALEGLLGALKNGGPLRAKLRDVIRVQVSAAMGRILEKFEDRRDRLRKRRQVTVVADGRLLELGAEPTNEAEVLILVGRMESILRKLFGGDFRALEHTSLLGIDGLIRIRRQPDALLEEAASVEYEFRLSSFFQHQHPLRHTKYVICWTVGDIRDGQVRFGPGGLRLDGPLSAELRPDGWMKALHVGDHIIHVLPLDKLPGLQVR